MRRSLFSCLPALLALAPAAHAYSVLSHEAIIDAAWDISLKPILRQRFPNASPDELKKAHAYAYGGAIIQDMGYYPFGSHLFSDLTHYIRSGDFIVNMLEEARDLDETAFALGSLAHYAADNIGHDSINRSVPMLYPKVRARFGPVATYEDNPADHLRTEFSFDVVEVAENRYAPSAYHDFIGFEVSKPLLERAFEQTYGIPLKEVSKNLDLALGTYRRTVSSIIPKMTKVAWAAKKKELMAASPGLSRRRFVYALSRASFEKEWGKDYQRPSLWDRFLAFLFRLIPKVGPFRALAFRVPTPETQKLFMNGFASTFNVYREKLAEVRRNPKPVLANDNFDTGLPAHYGNYRLADEAADKLLVKLSERKFSTVDAAMRKSLLAFYGKDVPADPNAAAALQQLRTAATAVSSLPSAYASSSASDLE
jgi:hypothetical protein